MKKYNYFNIKYIVVLFLLISFSYCKEDKKAEKTINPFTKYAEGNKFLDETIQEIYKFQYENNYAKLSENLLLNYSDKPEYKVEALQAIASLQNINALKKIKEFLFDNNDNVRISAIKSIAKFKSVTAEQILIQNYKNQESGIIKSEIILALGNCGSENTLNFISNLDYKTFNTALQESIFSALSKLASNNIQNNKNILKGIDILKHQQPNENLKYQITNYLSKTNINVSIHADFLIKIYKKTANVYTKDNIISILHNFNTPSCYNFFADILDNENDYRLRISTIKSLYNFEYNSVELLLFNLLDDKNEHVAHVASKYFIDKGKKSSVERYFEKAKTISDWQTRANMLSVALKYSENKSQISKAIISGYEASENVYEKAQLLHALSNDIQQYDYVKKQTFSANDFTISTAGISALAEMRYLENFDEFNKKSNVNLELEFAEIFKKAILSGDIAMISIAAKVLSEEQFNFRKIYTNTYFITQAINKCELPRDYKAYKQLLKVNKFINGIDETDEISVIQQDTIDWEFIKSIPPRQKVEFVTNKGNFIVEMKINESPIAVSRFLKLVISKFYNNLKINDVLPNIQLQSGCWRGDSWGYSSNVISSNENINTEIQEGTLTLVSFGNNILSNQWFISYMPNPLLKEKQVVIGEIVTGLEVLHKLQISDNIISVNIIN